MSNEHSKIKNNKYLKFFCLFILLLMSINNTVLADPSSVSPAVATVVGTLSGQQMLYNKTFSRIDNFMSLPENERILMRYQNKTAYTGAGMQVFSPTFIPDEKAGIWTSDYSLFENVPVGNGPDISNVGYGIILGYDTDLKHLKNNVDVGLTFHTAYQGSRENFDDVKSIDSVGNVGMTGAIFKKKFFTALTVGAGGVYTRNTVGNGEENYHSFIAGLASKTGYNFEFKKGRYILQPSFLATYTFLKVSDFESSKGKDIKINNVHAVQIIPELKLIGNFEGGWQPYLGLSLIWTLLDSPAIFESGVLRDRISFAPYCEYGGGLQRKWKDRYTSYGQVMMRGGGRNGVSLFFGFRLGLGK